VARASNMADEQSGMSGILVLGCSAVRASNTQSSNNRWRISITEPENR
jgi:hypothetical protein